MKDSLKKYVDELKAGKGISNDMFKRKVARDLVRTATVEETGILARIALSKAIRRGLLPALVVGGGIGLAAWATYETVIEAHEAFVTTGGCQDLRNQYITLDKECKPVETIDEKSLMFLLADDATRLNALQTVPGICQHFQKMYDQLSDKPGTHKSSPILFTHGSTSKSESLLPIQHSTRVLSYGRHEKWANRSRHSPAAYNWQQSLNNFTVDLKDGPLLSVDALLIRRPLG